MQPGSSRTKNVQVTCSLAALIRIFVKGTMDEDQGIKTMIEAFQDESPLPDGVDYNESFRRHLSESQRAAIAAKLANMRLGDNQYKSGSVNLPTHTISQPQAAEMLNVSISMVGKIKAIEREAPELLPKIESGEMTMDEDAQKVKTMIEAFLADLRPGTRLEIPNVGRLEYQAGRRLTYFRFRDGVTTLWELPDRNEQSARRGSG